MSQKDSGKTPSITSTDSNSQVETSMDEHGMMDETRQNGLEQASGLSMDEVMDQGAMEPLWDDLEGSEGTPLMEDGDNLMTSPEDRSPLPQVGSTTLSQIPVSMRPKPSTVCEHCPASMWFSTPSTLQNYCRITHKISWSTSEPVELTHCDGIAIASAAAAGG